MLTSLLSAVALLSACRAEPPADEKAVRAVLDAQTAAWNKGDLDGFMKGYWKDEKLTFISGGNIRRGWDETRKRYQERYFTPGADGKTPERGDLTFDELQMESLAADVMLVRGRFVLTKGGEKDWGRFTLVVRKLPDGWRITHDHTSVPPPPEKK